MGTTKQKLQRVLQSKLDMKAALEGHGYVMDDVPLKDYASRIANIHHTETTSQKYCVGRFHEYLADTPTAVKISGSPAVALDWYPALFDLTPVEGVTKLKPVGWLKRNNFLRFTDGSFAPTVGITEAQRAECDVALYLDSEATNLYCAAGEFDAAAFYNAYGMDTPLYDAEGNSVRILRPWETTETKYTIGICRKDTVYLLDHELGADGYQLNGIIADDGHVDGIVPTHKLVPTALTPDPCTVKNGKIRCFFFAYPSQDTGCKGLSPNHELTGSGELFYGDGTYPRTLDNDVEGANGNYPNDDDIGMSQAKNAKVARACNYDPTKSFPVAEGGWHALNTFITCLEAAYGTRNLYAASKFSSGTSSNDNGNNETNWLQYGGVRYKLQTASEWSYALWNTQNSAIKYDAANRSEYLSLLINRYAPKWWCMEAQMALSFAAERNIAPDTNFTFYGKTYMYKDVPGATTLLNGRMNAKVYRTRVMTINAYSGGAAATFDVQARLRAPIAEGYNLCGDFYVYCGGGHEVIDLYASSIHTVKNYLECDQTKWADINHTVQQTEDFDFQSTYEDLGDTAIGTSNYYMLRQAYGTWKLANSTSINKGECGYHYEQSLGNAANTRYRAGVRFRGNAHHAYCSSRSVHSNSLASYCIANYGCSAQVLVDVGDEMQ